MAITCGMRRVTISHCEFRFGYSQPSCFINDLLAAHRVGVATHANIGRRPGKRSHSASPAFTRTIGPGHPSNRTASACGARRWDRLPGNQKEWDLEGEGWRTHAVDARVRRLCTRRDSRAALTRSRPRTDGMDGLRI